VTELPCLTTDTAYSCDPRIKKFKEEEKARKESEKKAKVDAKKKEQEEKERVSPIHSHNISTIECMGEMMQYPLPSPFPTVFTVFSVKDTRCVYRCIFID